MAEPASPEPEAAAVASGEQADSLLADLRNLAEDAQTAVEAELHYQKARAGYVAGAAKGIALWATLALVAAIFALFALAFGTLLALSATIGAWAATGVVTGGLLLVFAVAAAMAARAIRRVRRDAGEAPRA